MKSFPLIRCFLCICLLLAPAAGTRAASDNPPDSSGAVAADSDVGQSAPEEIEEAPDAGIEGQPDGERPSVNGTDAEPDPIPVAEPDPMPLKDLELPPKSVEIPGRYALGLVMDSPADPSDRYITALVQEARRRWNVPVSQIGWYAEGRKPGQGIQAMGQSDEGGNVSIRRAGNKEEALLLEKSLCYPTTPGKLSRDYLNNEVVADEDYRGKNVLFTSVISEIARGAFNRPYVFFPSEEGSYTGLTCYFSNNDPNLRKIRKGSAVTVRCTVKGFLMQDVLLERCDILEVLSP